MGLVRLVSGIMLIFIGAVLGISSLAGPNEPVQKCLLALFLGGLPFLWGFAMVRKSMRAKRLAAAVAIQTTPYEPIVAASSSIEPVKNIPSKAVEAQAESNLKAQYRKIKKTGKKFSSVSYEGGLPNIRKGLMRNRSFDIWASDEGISFRKPYSSEIVAHISWQNMIGIVCADEMSQKNQAFVTGLTANSRSVTDGMISGFIGSALQRHSLVFQYKQNAADQFVLEVAFNDTRNKKIKAGIMSKRSSMPQSISN